MSTAPGGSRCHVVFLVRSFGFPHGMAATNRLRLLGRALLENGASVRVLCTRASEREGDVRNAEARGYADGIPFLYTTGSTVRSPSFVARRWREARGFVAALGELARLRRRGELDCAYLADLPQGWRPDAWLLRRWLGSLGVPVVAELNELPGEIDWLPRRAGSLPRSAAELPGARAWLPASLSRRLSPLDGVDGAVAISAWLAEWAGAEAERISRPLSVIEVPILVDSHEHDGAPRPPVDPPTFVYAASGEYGRAVNFILAAMRRVWERHPRGRLIVTGMKPVTVAGLAADEGLREAIADGRVAGVGYVARDRLLELYGEATALLIPLFDDLRSRARFPTKIGEYLVAGRPVVTTGVGEIERFFRDGETAYIGPPGDAAAFAAKLVEVLDDPARAAEVGRAGRRLADERFAYDLYGAKLRAFIDDLRVNGPRRTP